MTGPAFWLLVVAAAWTWAEWPALARRYRQWRQDRADLRRVRHAADHWRHPRCLP